MRRSAILAVVAVALALCLAPAVTHAATVFDTYPGYSGTGWSIKYVSTPTGMYYDAAACQFTVTGNDYWLDSVSLSLYKVSSTASVIVSLMADNIDSPGTVLGTKTLDLTGDTNNMSYSVNTLLGTGIRLNQDTSYWIALEPGSDGTNVVWEYSGSSLGSVYWNWSWGWFDPQFTTDLNLGAFTVYGTPVAAEVVPEPSALILALLGGSGAMGGIVLRKRK